MKQPRQQYMQRQARAIRRYATALVRAGTLSAPSLEIAARRWVLLCAEKYAKGY